MKHFIISLFTCTLFLVYSMCCFADDLRKENVGIGLLQNAMYRNMAFIYIQLMNTMTRLQK